MKRFKITKGHNLKLDGHPSDEIIIIKEPSIISFHPYSYSHVICDFIHFHSILITSHSVSLFQFDSA